MFFLVIPAQAGIQVGRLQRRPLDSRFRGNDKGNTVEFAGKVALMRELHRVRKDALRVRRWGWETTYRSQLNLTHNAPLQPSDLSLVARPKREHRAAPRHDALHSVMEARP